MLKKIQEVYKYKELLYYFAWRDLRVRYKQTVLGALWVVLQPAALIAIFVLFLGQLGRVSNIGVPYSLFMFSALLFAQYATSVINTISNSVISNSAIIKKIYFPRSVPGFSQVIVSVVDFLIRSLLFLALFPLLGVKMHVIGLLALPILLLITTLFAVGLGFMFAALNVKYRDVKQALPLVNQVLFYMTPIIYAIEIVPENLQKFLAINPLVGIVTAGRDLFFTGTLSSPDFLISSIVIGAVMFVAGLAYFFKEEDNFVDTV